MAASSRIMGKEQGKSCPQPRSRRFYFSAHSGLMLISLGTNQHAVPATPLTAWCLAGPGQFRPCYIHVAHGLVRFYLLGYVNSEPKLSVSKNQMTNARLVFYLTESPDPFNTGVDSMNFDFLAHPPPGQPPQQQFYF